MGRAIVVTLALGIGFTGAAAGQNVPDSLPAGVTAEMVQSGAPLYAGQGLCAVCHSQNGKGMPGLGPDLTDEEWLHSDGSYDAIVEQILNGIDASESKTGLAMAPKGGSSITDEQVRAVAAYVWSLRFAS
jgi:mono/diheme cytochrome c family protein